MHSFRLTEDEEAKVRADMASLDYLSVSKYIRSLLLRRYVPVQMVRITDRSIRNQINEISSKLSRIGTNFNQVVMKYNQSCSARKKNGDPVISSKATMFYFVKLYDLMTEVRREHEALIEQVSLIGRDEES